MKSSLDAMIRTGAYNARSSDPVTSHEAARTDPRTLEGVRWAVYREVVISRSGLADHELVARLTRKGVNVTPQRIRTARAELVRSELLAPAVDKFRKTSTGYRAKVWIARP